MSERTFLYGLSLKWAGTPFVEGLRSFFQRLAYTHNMKMYALWDLVHATYHVGIPRLGQLPAHELNGISICGDELRANLESATGTDLRLSTLMRFSSVLSSAHLLDPISDRYCPMCVGVSEFPEDIAGQLAWDVACVECCPIHGIMLEAPRCGALESEKIRARHCTLLPAVCFQCGSIGYHCRTNEVHAASSAQIWIAESVGRLVSMPLARSLNLSAGTLRIGLNDLLKARFAGSPVRAAQQCQFARATVRSWLFGESKPALHLLMILCFNAGADLASLLEGHYVAVPTPVGSIEYKRRSYSRSQSDRKKISHALNKASAMKNPPKRNELAEQLGVNPRLFRQLLPEESSKFAIARRDHVKRVKLEKREQFIATLQHTAESIAAEGKNVTRKRLLDRCGISIFPNSWRGPVLESFLRKYSPH